MTKPLLIVIAFFTFCVKLKAQPTLNLADSYQISSTGSYSTKIIFNAGVPYIMHESSSKLAVNRFDINNAKWDLIGSAGYFSKREGWYTNELTSSIAFLGNELYLAYTNPNKNYKATVIKANFSKATWDTVGYPEVSNGVTSYCSLAFSGLTPYVAYFDGRSFEAGGILKKLNASGISWENVGGSFDPSNEAYDISLHFNSGTPYVAYITGDGFSGAVKKLNAAGTGWELVGSAFFTPGTFESKSLAFEFLGSIPYVAFKDNTNSGKITVKRLNELNNTWEVVGNSAFSAGAATSISLIFNGNIPYVCFSDGGNNNKATLMRLNAAGTAWETIGTAGFSANAINSTSMAVYNSDLYVSYSGSDGVFLKKFSSSVLPIHLANYSAKVEGSYVKLNWNTVFERNNSYFIIERSLDGENYKILNTIPGKGDSDANQKYNLTDFSPLVGNNYYRLSQVDSDGKVTILGIKEATISSLSNNSFSVHPNPIKENEITITGLTGNHIVRIIDLKASIVFTGSITFNLQKATVHLAKKLPAGIFLLEVDGKWREKIVVVED